MANSNNSSDIIPVDGEVLDDSSLALPSFDALSMAGRAANQAARHAVFDDYVARRAPNTIRRQLGDLRLFAMFLEDAGVKTSGEDLQNFPDAWQGLTWGIVEGFKRWMMQQGYALGSVNIRLSTVKTYAKLATKAGAIPPEDHALIRLVTGYSHKEKRHVDNKRDVTRIGDKKDTPVRISQTDAYALINQPTDTPQGRRDRLLMCLLLEHGLRCGEVAGLKVDSVDLDMEILRFFRPKVNKEQVHRLTPNTFAAARAYFAEGDAPRKGRLLRASHKTGHLTRVGITERGITKRVRQLGKLIRIEGLSAHDCRHYWATRAARAGTDAFALQEAGGWTSLAMPRRYVEEAKVANEGIKGFGS